MTHRTRYGAWGGGATAGDLVIPGNNGGGYPRTQAHFFKAHDGSGLTLEDSVTGNSTGNFHADTAWDADKGAIVATTSSTPAFTFTDPSANEDYIFIAVVEANDTGFACQYGAAGLSKGFNLTRSDVTYRNDTPTAETTAYGTIIPLDTPVAIYFQVDDSAATLAAGWYSATAEAHGSESAMTGGSACSFTDTFKLQDCTMYSCGVLIYPEAAPTLTTIKSAAEWMLAQHTSAECKANPTKRIIYPGL